MAAPPPPAAGPAAPRAGRRAVWLSALLLAALLFGLHLTVFPPAGWFGGDMGTKYLQARGALEHGPLTPWIDYPGRDLDPELEHHGLFMVERNGQVLGIFPPAFSTATAPFLALLGLPGLYLLPALGAALVLLASHALARRLLPPPAALAAAWLAAVATPVLFYGAELWEHAPAAGLTTAAAALLGLRALGEGSRRADLLAGLLLGAAAALRPESVLMLPALLAGLALSRGWRDALRPLPFSAAGVALGLVPQILLNRALFGGMGSAQLARNFGGSAGHRLEALGIAVRELLLPLHGLPLYLLAWVVLVAALAAHRLRPSGSGPEPSGSGPRLVGAWVVAALFLVPALVLPAWHLALGGARFGEAFGYRSIAHTWPLAILLIFPLLMGAPEDATAAGDDRRALRRTLVWSALLYVAAVILAAPVPGGFQFGARLLLPAAPLAAVAAAAGMYGLRRRLADPAPRRALHAAAVLLVLSALTVQAVGLAFLLRSKRLYEGITRATAAATRPGEPILTDLFWYPQVTALLYPERRYLLVGTEAQVDELARRAAAAGLARIVLVTGEQESELATPAALPSTGPALFGKGETLDLPGRGLTMHYYPRLEPGAGRAAGTAGDEIRGETHE